MLVSCQGIAAGWQFHTMYKLVTGQGLLIRPVNLQSLTAKLFGTPAANLLHHICTSDFIVAAGLWQLHVRLRLSSEQGFTNSYHRLAMHSYTVKQTFSQPDKDNVKT